MLKKIIFLGFFLFVLSKNIWAIEGCFCGSGSSCYPDGCTRKTIKNDGSIDYNLCGSAGCGGAYNACYDTNSVDANRYFCLEQPPCCEEMVRRNDPEACCWPERGYCHPEYCKQVSRPEKCGWYWQWHDNIPEWMARPYGYGCVRGTSRENMEPVFGLPKIAGGGSTPTSKPTIIPTQKPTEISVPTKQPTPTTLLIPTERNQPTKIVPSPTRFNLPINTPTTLPSTSFPSSFFPSPTKSIPMVTPFNSNFKENLITALQNIIKEVEQVRIKAKIATKKIAEPQKKIFLKAKEMDQKLENYLNERIIFLTLRIFKFKLSF